MHKKSGSLLKPSFLAMVSTFAIAGSGHAIPLILDFNSGVDSFGNASGDLVFNGPNGEQIRFTDDNSGSDDGVQITNGGAGNIQAGTTNFVLGSNNTLHSSGIVAIFSSGVEAVSFFDTDNDATVKALFAFDAAGELIGQTGFGTQIPFSLDLSDTGGLLIHSIEFDTAPGTAGGANDGTVFTIDNFSATFTQVPAPASVGLLGLGLLLMAGATRKISNRD